MKIAKMFAAALATGLLVSPTLQAKPKSFDLTPFNGSYTGTVFITAMGQGVVGQVRTRIHASKNGRTATISYLAIASSGGTSLALPANFTLARNQTARIDDIILGINSVHPRALIPGSGSYTARKNHFTINLTSVEGIPLTVTGAVRDTGRKRKLDLNFYLGAFGYTYLNTLTAPRPKN
ncbi:MAG TPA: hypothetical protein VNB29_02215 [Chthoniobacterales bacterium]|nr:hypothetical protein [Chthoniobacterales bacterium]